MSKFDLNQSIEILSTTPVILKTWLTGLSDEWINSNRGGESWSPYDIMGHLIHGEKTDWIPRAKIILSNAAGVFEPFDRFAQFENSRGKTLHDLLHEFHTLRVANIRELRQLPIPENLDRTANHPELGQVTLHELLSAWTVHDLGHISQISQTMAYQYKPEVGPWNRKDYLKVLF